MERSRKAFRRLSHDHVKITWAYVGLLCFLWLAWMLCRFLAVLMEFSWMHAWKFRETEPECDEKIVTKFILRSYGGSAPQSADHLFPSFSVDFRQFPSVFVSFRQLPLASLSSYSAFISFRRLPSILRGLQRLESSGYVRSPLCGCHGRSYVSTHVCTTEVHGSYGGL